MDSSALNCLLLSLLAVCLGYASSVGVPNCRGYIKNKAKSWPYVRHYRNKCYAYFSGRDKTSWDGANEKCANFSNGKLAMAKDEITNNFLIGTMMRNKERTWIGLREYDFVKHKFKWVDGSPLRSRHPFALGIIYSLSLLWKVHDPCVAMDKKGTWHDYPCMSLHGNNRPFICEWNHEVTPTTPPTTDPTTAKLGVITLTLRPSSCRFANCSKSHLFTYFPKRK